MFFQDFPGVSYKFGTEAESNFIQNISAYSDIIDDVKDSLDFYNYYNVLDERPDQLSYKLYGSVNFYWTFFLMNDKIRRQGWPVSQVEMDAWIKKRYYRTVITTRNSLADVFPVGTTITGISSGKTGTINKRVEDLGQIFLNTGGQSFISGELISDIDGNVVTVQSSVDGYNAVKHYLDENGEFIDINPLEGPGGLYTPVTYYEYLIEENDKLKNIRVLKQEAINSVVSVFREAMRSR